MLEFEFSPLLGVCQYFEKPKWAGAGKWVNGSCSLLIKSSQKASLEGFEPTTRCLEATFPILKDSFYSYLNLIPRLCRTG